ncbi:MAG TPA: hypothetical protein VHZ99_10370 [Steroidobacteraceae bacterium]|jgi:hypothetical protein|nr:hypothetical protein [Steroidobacteraceae bacterium]
MGGASSPALAGPPFVTDDPEPTGAGHWENYLYSQGASTAGQSLRAQAGIEINYGAADNTQLSFRAPLNPDPGPGGMGTVWSALGGGMKYRFVQEDVHGWRPQVGIFPQVSIPVGPLNRGAAVTTLLPIWLQKSMGKWTTCGGGGYTFNPGTGNRNFLIYGWALQRQLTTRLSSGVEVFGQTSDSAHDRSATAVGIASQYDFSSLWHIVVSVNTGVAAASQSDRYSYNLALKWTP